MISRVWLTVVKRRIALGVLCAVAVGASIYAARRTPVRDFTLDVRAVDAAPAVKVLTPEPEPGFTPFTLQPKLINVAEVERLLQQFYPPLLRDAGIGGRAILWFYIDETGRVLETKVHESSGYEALDAAAVRVAERLRFTPGKNRDKAVPVWVQLPIAFTSK